MRKRRPPPLNGSTETLPTTPREMAPREMAPPPIFDEYVPRIPDKPMSPKELAGFLGVSPATIRRHLRRDELPYFRVGNQIRFLPGQVIQHYRRQKDPK